MTGADGGLCQLGKTELFQKLKRSLDRVILRCIFTFQEIVYSKLPIINSITWADFPKAVSRHLGEVIAADTERAAMKDGVSRS